MSLLMILKYPDPRLRIKAKEVVQVDQFLQQIIDNMLETMYNAEGIGLAATQVNIDKRIVVMDLSNTRDQPEVLINPVYEPIGSDKSNLQEGCLSVPGFFEVLDRYDNIKLTARDRHNKVYSKIYNGIAAVCVQHEIDHLDGKLFIDALSALKKERISEKLRKAKN